MLLRPAPRLLAVVIPAVVLAAGCSGDAAPAQPAPTGGVVQGQSTAEPGPACSPPPLLAGGLPDAFPVDVALPRGGGLTTVEEAGGYALANGRAPGTVAEVLAQFRAALPAAGLFVGRDEDEGRGGQLTFLGASTEGVVTVAVTRCPAGAVQFTLSARRTR